MSHIIFHVKNNTACHNRFLSQGKSKKPKMLLGMNFSEYTLPELCKWPTRAKGDTRHFKARVTVTCKYKVCFKKCMDPCPSYVFQFIENFWGYWTGSYYGQWISRFPIENSASELRFATNQWMQSVFHELWKEIGFKSMDQKYWKAVAWKVSRTRLREWFSVRCIENFRKESYCPKSLPRRFSAEICSKPLYIFSRIYENRTIGHQEPTHLKLTQLK